MTPKRGRGKRARAQRARIKKGRADRFIIRAIQRATRSKN